MHTDDDEVTRHRHAVSNVGIVVRVLIETVLAGHLVVFAFYWWLSPHEYPVTHSRFWLNSVIPVAIVGVVVLALADMLRGRVAIPGLALAGCASAWGVAAVASRLWFPASLRIMWISGVMVAFVIAGCSFSLLRRAHLAAGWLLATSVLSALVGLFVVWAQIPPAPNTAPWGTSVPRAADGEPQHEVSPLVPIAENARFHPAVAELAVDCGAVHIRCSPLLTFDRVSPDGFWSILAPDVAIERRVTQHTATSGSHAFHYSDGSAIEVSSTADTSGVEVAAYSVVERDTYSHLNSFCVIDVRGHQKLSIAFSPCQQTLVDVLPADYPTGRPARFAYLDQFEMFHVVEAASGEKGPFRRLASGPLSRGEPLTLVLHDDGRRVASIGIDDWTRQLSTTPSPTAGWRVPVNAIEFQRLGASENAPVKVWITLAATSVGRGWDCVGHRAGTYRNRLDFDIDDP
jgi:hypothetical protein